jgi:hypothetical protein
MSFSAEATQTKESNELKQTKEVKKPKELPRYIYQTLGNKDALRLLRLIPAEDRQEDIDCEIIEINLPKKGENTGDALEEPKEEPKDEQKEDPEGKQKAEPKHGARDETKNGQNETTNGEPQSPDQIQQAIKSNLMSVLENYDGDDDEKSTSSESEDEKEESTPEKEVKVKEDNKNESYEAVSWCWGREPHDQVLRVHDNTKVFAFPISKNLKRALWALRMMRCANCGLTQYVSTKAIQRSVTSKCLGWTGFMEAHRTSASGSATRARTASLQWSLSGTECWNSGNLMS